MSQAAKMEVIAEPDRGNKGGRSLGTAAVGAGAGAGMRVTSGSGSNSGLQARQSSAQFLRRGSGNSADSDSTALVFRRKFALEVCSPLSCVLLA
jgi:hypothetical protein